MGSAVAQAGAVSITVGGKTNISLLQQHRLPLQGSAIHFIELGFVCSAEAKSSRCVYGFFSVYATKINLQLLSKVS